MTPMQKEYCLDIIRQLAKKSLTHRQRLELLSFLKRIIDSTK